MLSLPIATIRIVKKKFIVDFLTFVAAKNHTAAMTDVDSISVRRIGLAQAVAVFDAWMAGRRSNQNRNIPDGCIINKPTQVGTSGVVNRKRN